MAHPTGVLPPAVFVAASLALACSSPPPPLRRSPPKLELKPCGTEELRHGEGYNAAARECLWQAYQDRQPAEFTTTLYTIEGDPISYRVQLTPKAYIVTVDSKDRYGTQGVMTHKCETFERIRQDERPDRFGFALSRCTGGGSDRVGVP
ncbi:MAG TPA: hypothetical protein VLS89_02655 [Candidatus Nanopelagicales bacterium]|nr:hypothetical protein [Candidatus Nanopelagicales bacterium]